MGPSKCWQQSLQDTESTATLNLCKEKENMVDGSSPFPISNLELMRSKSTSNLKESRHIISNTVAYALERDDQNFPFVPWLLQRDLQTGSQGTDIHQTS